MSHMQRIDEIDAKYRYLTESWNEYPLTEGVKELIALLEKYRAEMCYFHDKFIECLM